MDGFEPQPVEQQSRAIPWKRIAIIGGGVLILVIAGLTVWYFRGRNQVSLIEQKRVEQVVEQVGQSLVVCEDAADREACERRTVGSEAERLGTVEVCKLLEGDAYDNCVWKLALDRDDASLCAAMLEQTRATGCADGLFVQQALVASDARLCAKITSAERRQQCLDVLDPITSLNCAERGLGEDACRVIDVIEQAVIAQDPALCGQIVEGSDRVRCLLSVPILDRDFDGLLDREEIGTTKTDPLKSDTDGDGLNDFDEVRTYQTDPLVADTDGDGFTDGDEVAAGYDPDGPGRLE